MGSDIAVMTEGLAKRYGSVDALADLDLEVRRGEALGYLGPNGAGKTTTIRLLLAMARPTRGRAEIFGLDCQRQSVDAAVAPNWTADGVMLGIGAAGAIVGLAWFSRRDLRGV